ncbi:methyltransferase domain-containing protein [Kitasatospora sp. NPDC058965]|uniref:methyltransferase domain-containing protein n=1 Tax=Kitasatospora sp. NPDC058965 TaxID=3346682 RepID=UPI0036915964
MVDFWMVLSPWHSTLAQEISGVKVYTNGRAAAYAAWPEWAARPTGRESGPVDLNVDAPRTEPSGPPAGAARDWDWEDPDALAGHLAEFSAELAECRRIEVVSDTLPRTAEDFSALGLDGIEFAAFRTRHPRGLGSDIAPMHSGNSRTEFGKVYRIDGSALFTMLDVAAPLPFADASLDWVYAEHLVEHIPLPVAVGWLREVRRVLRPGGLLRLTTPDLARYVEGYAEPAGGFFARHRRRLRLMRVGPPMPERRAFMLNQIFYHYGHRWIYDEAELRHALGAAGFPADGMRRRTFQQGARPDLAELDTVFRNDETLYLEATAN